MIEFFFEILVNACEKIFYAYFLSKYMKPISKIRIVCGVITMFVFETIINKLSFNSNYQLIIFYLADTLFIFMAFRGSVFRKLVLGTSEILISGIANAVTFFITDNFTSLDITKASIPSETRIIMISMYSLICALLFFLCSRRRQKSYQMPPYLTIALIFLILIGVLAIDQTLDISINTVPAENTNPIFSTSYISMCILFILLGIILLFEVVGITLNKNLTLELENHQYKAEQQQIEDMHNSIHTLRMLKHDYQQHLDTINGLLITKDYDSIGKYLEDLDMSSYEFITVTGNSIIDSLLSAKIMLARSHHINVSYEFFLPDKLSILSTDLSIVLGNIMDNAIEACDKFFPEASRYISLDIRPVRSMLYIKITNASTGFYLIDEDVYQTTKADSNHGIGLKRCKELIEKYNGFCNFIGNEREFISSIVLPL